MCTLYNNKKTKSTFYFESETVFDQPQQQSVPDVQENSSDNDKIVTIKVSIIFHVV